MNTWDEYKKIFNESFLDDIYKNHIILGAATGIDKVNHDVFMKEQKKQIEIISKKAILGTYKFTKYKLKLVSKGRGEIPREISIPTIRDRIFMRGLCDYLNLIFKDDINFDLPQNVIKSVKETIFSNKYTAFIKLDVKNFYPNIDHEILLNRIKLRIKRPEILNVIESSIKTPAVEKASEIIGENKDGVPQGLSISNVLAAIYLSEIDKKFALEKFAYYRYVDDILILCEQEKVDDISKEIITEFENIDLTIHKPTDESEKSTIGKLGKDNFTYLGYMFLPNKVTVRKNSIDRLKDSLTAIFTANKYSKNYGKDFLLWRLNLRICGCIFENKRKGWLFFFSEITDLDLLHRLDHFIKQLCKRFEVEIKPKSFVRAYYQLKHHIYETKYIPNFDNFSIDDMKNILERYFSFKVSDLDTMEHGKIKYYFLKKISKQVRELDTDLQGFS